MAKGSTGNIAKLQKAGIIHAKHTMTQAEQEAVESLSEGEVQALISVKNKLGVSLLKKTAKGGRFPHPLGVSF